MMGAATRSNWVELEFHSVLKQFKEKYKPKGVEQAFYIGLEHIEKNTGKLTDEVCVADISATKSKFRDSQILYGKLRPYLNKVYLSNREGVCSTDILVFDISSAIEAKYALNFMLSRRFVNDMSANTSGVNLPRVSTRYINAYPTPLAPLPEQRAIVAKIEQLFSKLDNGIANLKAAQKKLAIYRQAVLKKAFEGELTRQWRERQTNLPEWVRKKVSEFGQVLTGNTPLKKNADFYSKKDYPFYKPTDLDAGERVAKSIDGLSKLGFETCRSVPANSILVTCIGATIGKTGLVAREGGFNQQINAILPSKGVNSKFVYYQAIGIDFQDAIKSSASSTTLPILNKGKFSNLEMIICSPKEQAQIVKEIESRFSLCDHLQQEIKQGLQKAEALRQSVLKKAFEGRLLTDTELAACHAEPDWEPAQRLLARIQIEKGAKQKTGKSALSKKAICHKLRNIS